MSQSKKTTTLIVIIALIIVAGFLYRYEAAQAPMDQNPQTSAPIQIASTSDTTSKTECFYKKTTGQNGLSDHQFVSIVQKPMSTVEGIINFMPAEKDSMTGTYTGDLGKNDDKATKENYPSIIDIMYKATGEGVTVMQQEVFALGSTGIKMGYGERVEASKDVYKFKDVSKLTFTDTLSKVDCATVPANVAAKYAHK